ncbi:hypothetical protein FRAAL2694 [Frankia alni ACN14a]|uniref:Uncharacterized protein n=1 Tax=Frankia alni (strain DSM 45986 / CECT 9034 / ACN14a) TaxID=326424 RepID=Q0RAL7_FRAAA|nr:hypothetical protein FRAAL2694 [Frankia alni ACN14a]
MSATRAAFQCSPGKRAGKCEQLPPKLLRDVLGDIETAISGNGDTAGRGNPVTGIRRSVSHVGPEHRPRR